MRTLVSNTYIVSCPLKFEHLKDAVKDGPLLDDHWKCRKCEQLVADHEIMTISLSTGIFYLNI
jgi:hypothetical protein